MAKDVGTKVFRVYAPTSKSSFDIPFDKYTIGVVVKKLHLWYEDKCSDLSECVIRLKHSSP
jgi:hypothetical protein